MAHNYGYVYCISNPSMPDLLKIGMTNRTPEQRLAEANGSDTWRPPTPYVIEFAKYVKNALQKEKTIHKLLEEYNERVNLDREFFKISVEKTRLYFELMDGDWWINVQSNIHTTRRGRQNRRNVTVTRETEVVGATEPLRAATAPVEEQEQIPTNVMPNTIQQNPVIKNYKEILYSTNINNISSNEKHTLIKFCIKNKRLNVKTNGQFFKENEIKNLKETNIIGKTFRAVITSHLVEDRIIKSSNYEQIMKELSDGTPNICVILEEI